MVDANFFCHQKKRKVKLDKVREGLITLSFRANVSAKTDFRVHSYPLDHLSVKMIFTGYLWIMAKGEISQKN